MKNTKKTRFIKRWNKTSKDFKELITGIIGLTIISIPAIILKKHLQEQLPLIYGILQIAILFWLTGIAMLISGILLMKTKDDGLGWAMLTLSIVLIIGLQILK